MTMRPNRSRHYLFDGQHVTVAQVRALLPAYGEKFIRRALGDGVTLRNPQKFAGTVSPWRHGIDFRKRPT